MTDPIYRQETGWQCPVCKSVWAPFVSRCEECAKRAKEAPTGADINAGCAHEWVRTIGSPFRWVCLQCTETRTTVPNATP